MNKGAINGRGVKDNELGSRPRLKSRVPNAVSLLCYVTALAILFMYRYSTKHDVKKVETCDTISQQTRWKTQLVQLLHGVNLLQHAKRSPPKTAKHTAQAQKIETKQTKFKPKQKVTLYFPEAHSKHLDLPEDQLKILREFSERVIRTVPDLHRRAKSVGWGGSQPWWPVHTRGSAIDEIDGGRLLWHHYKIMSKYMKNPSHLADGIHFPFKLCSKRGCSAEQSIQHSLEWREKYQPWRVTAAMIEENNNGWAYARGFSPSADSSSHKHYGRHALVWLRAGKHDVKDGLSYFRCILNAADRAIGEALHESHGHVGKFNVVIDGSGDKWPKLPNLQHIKQTIAMLQDHYTNRLGMIFLINLSRPAEFVIALVKPLITKDVREKIHILSHDPERRAVELASFVEPEFLPDWFGGPDTYQFDTSNYYPKRFYWSDKEGAEFLTTMPYHNLS